MPGAATAPASWVSGGAGSSRQQAASRTSASRSVSTSCRASTLSRSLAGRSTPSSSAGLPLSHATTNPPSHVPPPRLHPPQVQPPPCLPSRALIPSRDSDSVLRPSLFHSVVTLFLCDVGPPSHDHPVPSMWSSNTMEARRIHSSRCTRAQFCGMRGCMVVRRERHGKCSCSQWLARHMGSGWLRIVMKTNGR